MSVQFVENSGFKPSAQDLASFASRAGEIDLGDDVIELGDDMGVGLLTNQSKVAASPRAPPRQVSFNTAPGGGGGAMPSIQINPVDDLDVVNLDAAPGVSDIHINRDIEQPFVVDTGGGGEQSAPVQRLSPEDESRQKRDLLTKIQRLDGTGVSGMRVTMQNSLEEIKEEYEKRTDSRNLEASIRFQRNALMTFVTGVEMVNEKFGNRLPVKPRLKGWSESVHTNVEDFDDIFEELYDMYKDKTKMHPLLRLVGTLGVSGVMFHLTNASAERSGIPGMSDLLNENPELQRQFAQAMAAKMGGVGNFMSAAGGFGGAPAGFGGAPAGFGGGPAPTMSYSGPTQPPSPPRGPAPSQSSRVPFNMAAAAAEEAPRARREMRGPSGVDDVLKAFEAERMMNAAGGNPISGGHASIFAPNGPPPTPPRGVQILREGIGSQSDPMADFLNDDIGSIGSGSTMNTERRRGRPRRTAVTPVGSVLNLNV